MQPEEDQIAKLKKSTASFSTCACIGVLGLSCLDETVEEQMSGEFTQLAQSQRGSRIITGFIPLPI